MPELIKWLLWGFATLLGLRFLVSALVRASGVGGLFAGTVEDTQKAAIDAAVKANPAAFTSPTGQVLNGDQMVNDAAAIYYAFRLNFPPWDANGWYEDEQAAIDVLKKYNLTSFPKLANVYKNQYAGRDLKADILKYVSGSYFSQLPNRIWQ